MLDGNGVPSDFFADEHIRKGFSYAFDFETFINDVYLGEAVQNYGLALPGMPGYEADLDHYYFDLEKSAEYSRWLTSIMTASLLVTTPKAMSGQPVSASR